MFGLMKCAGHLQTPEQKHRRRLHTCGACRVIGGLYGRKSRVFLNNDAVFLGEVMSALSDSYEGLEQWNRPHRSRSCYFQPRNAECAPLSLQFAATAALIIAEFKLADQMEDSNRTFWKLPYRLFATSFLSAEERLGRWGFPLEELRRCSRTQAEREGGADADCASRSFEESLNHLAGPSATAAGLFFQHGARLAGKPAVEPAMAALGQSFGTLIYVLDALEDYGRDYKKNNFNALRPALGLHGPDLPAPHRDRVVQVLWGIAAKIESKFGQLPLPAKQVEYFSARLKTNLSRRLSGTSASADPACGLVPKQAMTFRSRSRAAMRTGKTLTDDRLKAWPKPFGWLHAPFVFLSASLAAFAFPGRAHSATSYDDFMALVFNLTFPRPALVAPARFSSVSSAPELPDLPESGMEEGEPGIGPPKKDKGSCCCDCDCDCCCPYNSCECCCGDGCSCDCCCGDGCNCDC